MPIKNLVLILLLPTLMSAGNSPTGNIRADLLSASPNTADTGVAPASILNRLPGKPGKDDRLKSPLLGSLLSLAVPGAGEIYAGSYVKAGIALAIEATAIAVAISLTNKGNAKTTEFQQYADAHWSAVRYAQWINKYGTDYNLGGGAAITINPNASLNSWDRVSFAAINDWERQPKKEGFSHTLPPYGDQQYYELIGKYNQFKFGWDQYTFGFDPTDGTPNSDGNNYNAIPDQMKTYSGERGKANDLYNHAAIAVGVILLNHVASAIDAFFTTRGHNADLVKADMGMAWENYGDTKTLATTLNLRISF